MVKKIYIAYGSNMDTFQMKHRCPGASVIGKAELEGYELLFKGSKTGAYATVEKEKGSKVPVLIWEITETDEKNLDRYEGFPSFYYKKSIPIKIEGIKKTAMIYIMHEDRLLGEPSSRYYRIIEDAYLKFGFNLNILKDALKASINI
ncbi:gamma-glutamylcyclotransferase family protein [Clostridium tertium]